MRRLRVSRAFAPLIFLAASLALAQSPVYRYFRTGNATETVAAPTPGFALMGGGNDLDSAFQWLCRHAGGGDLLVLRATGDDEYNTYIQGLCKLNSVATLVIPNRDAANNSFVAEKIRHASALFIAGGDQANYINFWMRTPVESALNDAIRRGVPMGGTSAGLAVLGEYTYSAQGDKPDDPNLDARTALADPFGPRVTLVQGFLDIPILKGIITDTHFARRNRMGRLVVFLARLNPPDEKSNISSEIAIVRGIGVEQGAALLLDPDGRAHVIGRGSAYFVELKDRPMVLAPHKPLALRNVEVRKFAPGSAFNLKTWEGDETRYTLNIEAGNIHSTQTGNAIY
jgi:cyanophycinase